MGARMKIALKGAGAVGVLSSVSMVERKGRFKSA
jgi:hypothetical protein